MCTTKGKTKAQAKNRRTSQTREHKRNARAVCTSKSESLLQAERASGEMCMKRVKQA